MSTEEHSYWTPSRPEKVMSVDIVQRKENITLVSKQIKLVPELRLSLGLAISCFGALKERLGRAMQSWATL